MMKRFGLILLAALVVFGCQEPTQPTDLTGTRTVTVEVREAGGEPLQNAGIVWERFTGLNAPVSGFGSTAEDGFARLVMSDISTSRDSVRLLVSPPNRAPFQGIEPVEVLTAICNDTLLVFSFQPLLQCGTLSATDTIRVKACPDVAGGSVRVCRYYPTDCPVGLIFTATDSSSGEVSIVPRVTGTTTSSLEVCATFTPTSSSTVVREFRTTIEGREATSGQVQIRLTVMVEATVDCSACPCPPSQTGALRTDTSCIGQETEFDLPLSDVLQPFDIGSDCVVEMNLVSVTNDDLISVVSGDKITVRGGQPIPDIEIEVEGRQAGDLVSTITYGLRVRNLGTGVTVDCAERVQINVTTPFVAGACRVDPLQTDSLRKCVFDDESTVDTVYLVNDGDCESSFTVGVSNTYFGTQPSGEVIVQPRSRVPVIVYMRVTKGQWDASPQAPYGTNGAKDFNATLVVRGCTEVDVPLQGIGVVNCFAFKYQCLREFRPPSFPNTYAESIQLVANQTNIVYQNDNQTFRRYDIWFEDIMDLGGGNYEFTLGTGDPDHNYAGGRFVRIAQGFQVLPGQSICDTYPAIASMECQDAKDNPTLGTPVLGGLVPGDVILFVKNDSQCALLWVQEISPDRVGQNSLLKVCLEICYPMFTLP